jgi:hypothetical protein
MNNLPEKPTELINQTGKTFNELLPNLDKYIKGGIMLIVLLLTLTVCGIGFLMAWRIQDPSKLIPVKRNNEACFKLEDGQVYCPEG